MAETVEQLESKLEALYEAQASGALVVKHGDTQLTFRSMIELEAAIAAVIRRLNRLNGVKRKPVYVKQNTKGL